MLKENGTDGQDESLLGNFIKTGGLDDQRLVLNKVNFLQTSWEKFKSL